MNFNLANILNLLGFGSNPVDLKKCDNTGVAEFSFSSVIFSRILLQMLNANLETQSLTDADITLPFKPCPDFTPSPAEDKTYENVVEGENLKQSESSESSGDDLTGVVKDLDVRVSQPVQNPVEFSSFPELKHVEFPLEEILPVKTHFRFRMDDLSLAPDFMRRLIKVSEYDGAKTHFFAVPEIKKVEHSPRVESQSKIILENDGDIPSAEGRIQLHLNFGIHVKEKSEGDRRILGEVSDKISEVDKNPELNVKVKGPIFKGDVSGEKAHDVKFEAMLPAMKGKGKDAEIPFTVHGNKTEIHPAVFEISEKVSEGKVITRENVKVQDVVEVVRNLISKDEDLSKDAEIILKLEPKELGEVVVKISRGDKGLNILFEVKDVEVKQVIESGMNNLKLMLEASNVNLEKVGVAFNDLNLNDENSKRDHVLKKFNRRRNFEVVESARIYGGSLIEAII